MNTHTDIVILLGPPGSGKGTLSSLCIKRLGWTQFSTGNLCRQHIADRTEIGKKIDFIIKSGKLISDSLIMELTHKWLELHLSLGKAIIFDGLPRTMAQAQALDELFKLLDVSIRVHIVRLHIADERIIERLQGRAICSSKECQAVHSLHNGSSLTPQQHMVCNECSSPLIKRAEDEEKVVRERLHIYHNHESEILSFYRDKGKHVHALDVEMSLENVYMQLLALIGKSL